ncbi:hypothetical protein [Sodalis sp. dw_96]|uniref:hypothetical protein n=1 Tax=Sodalis sp. dw_96 TaxID=2719794 RepID=UPI001BD545F8|nr:hypothetical protein [Sodalis sp. dw_96]
MKELENLSLTLNRVKLVAELALTTQCESSEMKIVLSLISDLASQRLPQSQRNAILYELFLQSDKE